ncbi:MAG: lysine--tRNA ligase, partial [Chloroflexota bacterium]
RRDSVGEESHRLLKKQTDIGDFVQATGEIFRTRMGEISLNVSDWTMLSKAVSPLPVAKESEVDGEVVRHSAFADVEERFRQRYADLAVNREVREIFWARAKVIQAIRKYLDDLDFLEVETPILQPIYGGAAAKPFTTHHNQLKQDLYLRISFELYLKKLLVGGIERVYEIGRDFRNEGVSFKHNPEFTQVEFYAAYWDYNDVMRATEGMVAAACMAVNGSLQIAYDGHEVDLTPPWPRVTMRDAIMQHSGIDYMQHRTADELATAMGSKEGAKGQAWGKLIDELFGEFVEPKLIQPTFIIDYPREISPFAKMIPDDPSHVERFEGFIAGMELCNAFTELNDPLDQEDRFIEMQEMYKSDDDESNPIDEDYLRAMRYGMPPNGGFGMGIDRLTMLLTDQKTIREVLLFPHLREK